MTDFVVGHREVVQRLKRLLGGGRFPHSLLFVGREGIGKKRVAHVASAFYLCPEGGCLKCRHCKRALSGVHPDMRVELPRGESILIEQVRSLKEWAHLAPMEGERKVAVIDDAHLMNPAAANAFLKTLEEPPEGTLFILITSEQSRLLPTIVSRCQTVRFSPLTKEEVRLICEREGAPERVKRLCVETGSLMFLRVGEEEIERAQEAARNLVEGPSPSLLQCQVWKQRTSFLLFLYLARRLLNERMRASGLNLRLWEMHRRLLEVEKLYYSSNVSLRSLYDYLVLRAA